MWNYRLNQHLEVGLCDNTVPADLRPHLHSEAQLSLILEGERTFCMGTNQVLLHPGDILYIGPNIPHKGLFQKSPFSCQNYYLDSDTFQLPKISWTLLRGAYQPNERNLPDHQFVTGILEKIENRVRTTELLSFPETNLAIPLQTTNCVGAMARVSGYSREHFSRTFKKQYGFSPRTIRMAQRANLARQLLRLGHSSLTVAYEAGYSDQSHLARQFGAIFGTSPKLYRESVSRLIGHSDKRAT